MVLFITIALVVFGEEPKRPASPVDAAGKAGKQSTEKL